VPVLLLDHFIELRRRQSDPCGRVLASKPAGRIGTLLDVAGHFGLSAGDAGARRGDVSPAKAQGRGMPASRAPKNLGKSTFAYPSRDGSRGVTAEHAADLGKANDVGPGRALGRGGGRGRELTD
jgi:hypothetical protein